MDAGFYHPDLGYWQSTGGDPTDLLPTYPEGTVQVPLKPGRDYEWQDGEWVHVPKPEPVPQIISRRQFYQGLATAGLITKEEALAALTGTLPSALTAIVNGIPDEDAAFAATAHLLASGEFDRSHPLIPVFAASQGMSDTDVDDFWRLCASRV